MAHPPPQQLSAWLAGHLEAATRAELDAHLSACAQCKEGLALLRELTLTPASSASGFEDTHISGPTADGSRAASATSDEVQPGFTIGRYVVQRRLGQGAMGLVFAAYDPRLDRHVALKLLRPDLPVVENRPLRQRLEREAQALARLSNPHVVAVHDLGDFGDALFIAMDLIEGQTLTDWLRTPRAWQEVQRVFLQAGEGLAAAHRAGLVHRDFKPDNVLVGSDGVVRVSDFGVSRRVTSSSRPAGHDEQETVSGAGTLIGTPNYMSPEQFDGRSADARCDQFGFCVALFEALCGQRPFAGDTLRALSESVHAGPPERIPSRNTLPRWLEALVLKGLSTRPEARFGSMGDLLAQLKGPAPSKRSARAISALALVVVGMLAWREVVRRREDPCAQIEARVAAAWDEPTRARVTAAVTHEPLPWAKDGAALVDDVFRRFLAQWARDSAATCRERDSGANVVARQACLEERFTGFVTFRDALLVPNDAALRHGISVLGQALGTSTCAIRPTYFEVPADTARRSDFVRLRDAYFTLRTRAVLEMVTVDELVTVKQLQQEASTLGFAQLAAAFRQTEGLVLVTRGDPRAAVTAFDDAAVLAEGAHLDVMVADTRRRLVRLWAEELDVKHARTLVLAMRAGYQRLGEDPEANFGALAAEASVLLEESRFDEAIAKMEKAISLIDPADSHSVTDEYRVLTLMQTRANHLDAALANARKASEHAREELGPQHPFYAANLNTEAGVLARLGRDEEALEMVKKALDILARDPDTREYTYLLFNHGLTLKRLNRAKEGLPLLGQAVALAEKRGEGYRLAQMQTGFAEALQEVGELPRALELSDSAVRTTEKAFDEKALQLAAPLSVKGGVLEALGRHVEAAATLRRCLEILAHPDADPVLREVTRYDLGRTLWSDPATRAAGVKLVRDVRAFFAARGSAFGPYVLEADEWLKSHGDTRSRPR